MLRPSRSLFLCAALSACAAAPQPTTDFRALGIAHSFVPADGLYCSGQPTREQFARLREAGVRHFITLRAGNEDGSGWEEAAGQELGIAVHRIPITGAADLTPANVERLQQAMADGAPVLVACRTSNRVGALLALKARREGQAPAAALQFGKACGLEKLEPQVRALLAQ